LLDEFAWPGAIASEYGVTAKAAAPLRNPRREILPKGSHGRGKSFERIGVILSQPDLKSQRVGLWCIINIGSVLAYVGFPSIMAYSVAKGGMMTFTKNLADYLKKYRIRVNQINPGWVLTEGEHHLKAVVEGLGENWLEEALNRN
jgi:NAD(P)-dependent dehydrogenase (short-subunit alcohol dehydrogenase family)